MKEELTKHLSSTFEFTNPKHILVALICSMPLLAMSILFVNLINRLNDVSATVNEQLAAQKEEKPIERSEPDVEFVSNEILVKVKKSSKSTINENPDNSGIESLNKVNKEFKVNKLEKVVKEGRASLVGKDLFGWYKISLPSDRKILKDKIQNLDKKETPLLIDETGQVKAPQSDNDKFTTILSTYRNLPELEAVEPNYVVHATFVPNDPFYSSSGSWGQSYPDMWGIKKLNLESAWDEASSSASIVVADIDTGMDINHQDLKDNVWTNIAEIPGNGIDDDGNGNIDDVNGWNFVGNSNKPDDDNGHGTHTAGTIGAIGNNGVGVIGVNWNVKLMPVKFLDSTGRGYLDAAANAIRYAADNGAKVLSNSWGGPASSLVSDAVDYAYSKNIVIVAAAGNSNTDAITLSPAGLAKVITVSAIDSNDDKAAFSSWGQKIDVAAPGVDVLSTRSSRDTICASRTVAGGLYCRLDGTSMATPHVSGLAALLLAKNPSLSNEDVRQVLRKTAQDVDDLGRDLNSGYGLVQANSAMSNAQPTLTAFISSPTNNSFIYGSAFSIIGTAKGPNFASCKLELVKPSSIVQLATCSLPIDNQTIGTVDTTQFDDGLNTIRLTVFDTSNNKAEFEVYPKATEAIVVNMDTTEELLSTGDMPLYGLAAPYNSGPFSGYTLEWGGPVNDKATLPVSWSSEGINLTNGGTGQIGGYGFVGILGSWNSRARGPGIYAVRLTGRAPGVKKETIGYFTLGGTLGWPVKVSNQLGGITQPVIVDLNGDNQNEVIVPGKRSIFVFNKDGSVLNGWPQNVLDTLSISAQISIPVVTDLDGDGKKEVIVGVSNSYFAGSPVHSRIYIFKSDGSLYSGWPKALNYSISPTVPAIGDVDGDGQKEIVYKDQSSALVAANQVFVFRKDGSLLPGWPRSLSGIYSNGGSVVLSDIDKNGKDDIVVTSYPEMTVLDYLGNTLSGWPRAIYQTNSTPAVVDMNGDGNLEITLQSATSTTPNDMLISLYDSSGNILPGWPVTLIGERGDSQYSPIFYDLNSDGQLEIVTPHLYKIEAYSYNGAKYSAFGNPPYGWYNSHPTVAKNTYGQNRILIAKHDPSTQEGGVYLLSSTGSVEWSQSLPYIQGSAVAADIDGDSRNEVFIRSGSFSQGFQYIYKYALGGTVPVNDILWPQYQFDTQHTGLFKDSSIATNIFTAQYFDNIDFTNLKTTKTEQTIKYNWGSAVPDPLISPDTYSVRWSGTFNFDTDTYRFNTQTDGQAKVFVDGVKVIDRVGGTTGTNQAALKMTAGVHEIKVEYAHNTGTARMLFNFVKAYSCFDMTADGSINSADLGVVSSHFGSTPIDPNPWDVNGDKIVTSADLGLVASKFGTKC